MATRRQELIYRATPYYWLLLIVGAEVAMGLMVAAGVHLVAFLIGPISVLMFGAWFWWQYTHRWTPRQEDRVPNIYD